MPATGFSVDSDVEALLGRFPEALKKVNAELVAAERRAAALIKNGKDVPIAEAQRIDRLRTQQASYAEKVAAQKAVKEQANKAIREIFANPTASSAVNSASATGGGGLRIFGQLNVDEALELKELAKKNKADQPFWKRAADLLNQHNPHNSIRAWLKGNPSTGNVGSLLKKLGGDKLAGQSEQEFSANVANMAGRVFLVSRVAKFVSDKMMEKGKYTELAQKVHKQVADERWQLARDYRYSSSGQGRLDETYALEQEKSFNKHMNIGAKLNPLAPLADLLLNGDIEGLKARRKQNILKEQLFKQSFGMTQDQMDGFNMAASKDPTVARRIYDRVLAGGITSVLGHMINGFISNKNQIEYNEEVLKRKQELMDTAYSERAKAAERFYMNANNIVARADADRRLAAVNTRELERITDWNQW